MNGPSTGKEKIRADKKDEEIKKKLRNLEFPSGDVDDLIFHKIELKKSKIKNKE